MTTLYKYIDYKYPDFFNRKYDEIFDNSYKNDFRNKENIFVFNKSLSKDKRKELTKNWKENDIKKLNKYKFLKDILEEEKDLKEFLKKIIFTLNNIKNYKETYNKNFIKFDIENIKNYCIFNRYFKTYFLFEDIIKDIYNLINNYTKNHCVYHIRKILYIMSLSNYGRKEEIISNLCLKNYIDKENLDFREKINIKLKNKRNVNIKINKLNEKLKLNEDPLNFFIKTK